MKKVDRKINISQRYIKSQRDILKNDSKIVNKDNHNSKSTASIDINSKNTTPISVELKESTIKNKFVPHSGYYVKNSWVTPQKVTSTDLEVSKQSDFTPSHKSIKSISGKYKNQIPPATAETSGRFRKSKKWKTGFERRLKDYNDYKSTNSTPKEQVVQQSKPKKEPKSIYTNKTKVNTKGQSQISQKYSVLKKNGLDVIQSSPVKEERKTRYAVEKQVKPAKHSKHSAYPTKGIYSLNVNSDTDSCSIKKRKMKKDNPLRQHKMIKREINKSPRQDVIK